MFDPQPGTVVLKDPVLPQLWLRFNPWPGEHPYAWPKKKKKKKFTNSSFQGNANQNHNEVSPLTCEKRLFSKRQKITGGREDVEERRPLGSADENVNWYHHYGKHYGGASKGEK